MILSYEEHEPEAPASDLDRSRSACILFLVCAQSLGSSSGIRSRGNSASRQSTVPDTQHTQCVPTGLGKNRAKLRGIDSSKSIKA